MTTLTGPNPTTSPSAQLAEDLGGVVDGLLEQTTQGFLERIEAHGLSPVHARLLRSMDRSLNAIPTADLAARTAIDARSLARGLAQLHERDLVIDVAAPGESPSALALTRRGRAIVHDLDRARRADLRAFVDGLDHTERLRLEAAIHLLSGDLR